MVLYHGANGDKILKILSTGLIFPDKERKIYFGQYDRTRLYMHGGDTSRSASFVVMLQVSNSFLKGYPTSTSGVPSTFIIESSTPIPVNVLELYARVKTEEGFEEEKVEGKENIKEYLEQRKKIKTAVL